MEEPSQFCEPSCVPPLTDFYPYHEVPKDGDLDELIFYGLEWKQSER